MAASVVCFKQGRANRRENRRQRLLSMRDTYIYMLRETDSELKANEENGVHFLDLWTLTNSPDRHKYPDIMKEHRPRLRLLQKREDIVESISRLDRIIGKCSSIILESQSETDVISGGTEEKHENLMDVGGEENFFVDMGHSTAPSVGQQQVLHMENFLSRPVEIASGEVKVGDTLTDVYRIWDIFTLNPTVRAKLRNFAFLRANMRVKISVSGTPFHYGRFLCSYQPHNFRNQNLSSYASSLSADALFRKPYLAYLSQAPGAVTMDVKANKPIEMSIPFISTKPMNRLFNDATTALAAGTSFADFEYFGSLYFWTIAALQAVGDDCSPISYQIYAWLEDVQLGTSTASLLGITTESADERKTGPIERIATSAATISRALSVVPMIENMAKASAMTFNGIAEIAAWFGWSKPDIIDRPSFMKNRPYANTSHVIGSETVEKISFDPLQELTVDPGVCGITTDELCISHLCGIESYLTSFDWASTDDLMADPIFRCGVTPSLDCMKELDIVETHLYFQPTPMSFVASMFDYWRGDVEFRFDIVCSAFHRGKLGFYTETNVSQGALIDADLSTNKVFMKVVDIQETQSVSFCVKWQSDRAWLKVSPPGNSRYATRDFSYTLTSLGYWNGYIGVVVFTDLQSPDDSTIHVDVYVKSTNMQFNHVSGDNLHLGRLIAESSPDSPTLDNYVTCLNLNESTASAAYTSDYHFGEQPLSLRSLMKRYVTEGDFASTTTSSHTSIQIINQVVPSPHPQYGVAALTGGDYIVPLRYLRYAFLGMRGGVRRHLRFLTNATQYVQGRASVGFGAKNSNLLNGSIALSTTSSALTTKGNVAFLPHTNGGIEVEFPYYSINLFSFAFADDDIGDVNNAGDMTTEWFKNYTFANDAEKIAATTTAYRFTSDFAVGEDFSLMRFSGAPYYSVATP